MKKLLVKLKARKRIASDLNRLHRIGYIVHNFAETLDNLGSELPFGASDEIADEYFEVVDRLSSLANDIKNVTHNDIWEEYVRHATNNR